MDQSPRKLASLKGAFKAANAAGDEVLEFPRSILRRAAAFRLAAPLCVIAGVACIAIAELGNERLGDVVAQIRHSYELRRELYTLGLLATNAETAQRGYLITRRREYLDPYLDAFPKVPEVIERIRQMSAGDSERLALIDALQQRVDDKFSELRASITLFDAGREEQAMAMLNSDVGKLNADRIRGAINTLLELEEARTNQHARRWQDDLRFQRLAVTFAVALNILLVLVLLRSVRRELESERDESARLDLLVRERTEELSELASHLQGAREEEKSMLARELHDELGAILTASRMDVAWVRRKAPDLAPEVLAKLQRVLEHLDQGVALKRRIIEGLVPSALLNLGLVPALESLMEDFAHRSEVRTQTELSDDMPVLTREQSVAVYRIVQEALTNIERHAQARNVSLRLRVEENTLHIRIADDGRGMANTDVRRLRSHGLRGMRQRVAALRGELTLSSAPGAGTTITVSLPLEPVVSSA
ncbi:MAG: CHASE3 domain-containing protein [Rhodocyclaceae bacterium]